MTINPVSKAILLIALGCYLIALCMHPYITNEPEASERGISLLLFGWGGVFLPKANFAWFSNPLILLSVLLIKDCPKMSVYLAGVSFLIGFDLFRLYSLGFDSSRDIYASKVTGIDVGAYLWLFSLFLGFVAALIQICFRPDDSAVRKSPKY